jgi:hypothetical protein
MSYSSSPGAGGTYDEFNSAASAAMSGVHTRQQGFDFFGHARIAKSPASVFGLFQYFQPNTNFVPSSIGLTDNPLDFERIVAGVNFKITSHFSLAVGNQHLRWLHPQGLATGGNTNGIVGWTQSNYWPLGGGDNLALPVGSVKPI